MDLWRALNRNLHIHILRRNRNRTRHDRIVRCHNSSRVVDHCGQHFDLCRQSCQCVFNLAFPILDLIPPGLHVFHLAQQGRQIILADRNIIWSSDCAVAAAGQNFIFGARTYGCCGGCQRLPNTILPDGVGRNCTAGFVLEQVANRRQNIFNISRGTFRVPKKKTTKKCIYHVWRTNGNQRLVLRWFVLTDNYGSSISMYISLQNFIIKQVYEKTSADACTQSILLGVIRTELGHFTTNNIFFNK